MEGLAKLAFANRLQKVVNAGKLSDEGLRRVHQAEPITNNVNNRINARAKRGESGLLPKGQMTASKFKGISNPDNLPSRAPMDTRRIMKREGRENSKVLAELGRQSGVKPNVRRVNDNSLDGTSELIYNNIKNTPNSWDIVLPKRNATKSMYGETPNANVSKELRGLTAKHEIQGEAASQAKTLQLLREERNAQNIDFDIFRMNGHNNPEVLFGDAEYIRRMSPASRDLYKQKNKANVTEFTNGNQHLDESQLMNVIREPGGVVTPENRNRLFNKSFFEGKPANREDLRNSLIEIAKGNGHGNMDVVPKVVDDYMNIPFNTRTDKKRF